MAQDKDCIFCKIVKGEIPLTKVYDDENFIGILDIHPKAEGHTLIIPKNHFNTLLDMPNTLGNELIEAIKHVGLKLIKDGKVKASLLSSDNKNSKIPDKSVNEVEGFNVFVNNGEVAGQVVLHAHVHVIPRRKNDGLKSMA